MFRIREVSGSKLRPGTRFLADFVNPYRGYIKALISLYKGHRQPLYLFYAFLDMCTKYKIS